MATPCNSGGRIKLQFTNCCKHHPPADVVEAHARVWNVTGYLVSNHVAVAMEQKNRL